MRFLIFIAIATALLAIAVEGQERIPDFERYEIAPRDKSPTASR